MQFYSTNNPTLSASFQEALFQGLPADNGLYMPSQIPAMPPVFLQNLSKLSFQNIAFEIARSFLSDDIPDNDLKNIIRKSINFPAPVHQLNQNTGILELFHGPSLAFKDFGARFMAQTMAYFNRDYTRPLTILVATSGDTGGAVAAGFYKTPGIRVIILYPKGKVSTLQEKQLTTLGHNITALEIEGTFDDCQALVKQSFLDQELRNKLQLSSANSINVSRLIPQIFYYWEAFKQVQHLNKKTVFVVPSGNFGNLTAGLIAQKMGLPVHHFVAATNINDVVPEYLESGSFKPRPSIATLSNAMDVGNPSNFARMLDLFGSTWNITKNHVSGFRFNDEATKTAMKAVNQQFNYTLDPHAAVGYLAWLSYQKNNPETFGIVLATAHAAKFLPNIEIILGNKIAIPESLKQLANKEKKAVPMPVDYPTLKNWLVFNIKNI